MPLTLRVDGERWRQHLQAVARDYPRVVPVVKGNGYGLGTSRLARRSGWLGADTVAVGTYDEVPDMLSRFTGDVLVMEPWRPFLQAPDDRRVIHTLGRVEDVLELSRQRSRARVVLEGVTSMTRHGLTVQELPAATRALGTLRLGGLALHLPMSGDRSGEADHWCAVLEGSRLGTTTVYVSHLAEDELTAVAGRHPRLRVRPRVGTALWLGDRSALHPCATVLDVHGVRRGQRVGYRQRRLPGNGWLLVVAGGTSHGIGLESPSAGTTLRSRAIPLARGGLDAAGFALSPFSVGGRQRWFAEPPHMQVSLLFLPRHVDPPRVGDEIPVDVRYTTTRFDTVAIT